MFLTRKDYLRSYRNKMRDKQNKYQRIYRKSPEKRAKSLIQNARNRSRISGKEINISEKWIQEKLNLGVCELSGVPFTYDILGHRLFKAPSLDRIDNTKGYTEDNCKIILTWLNLAKSTMQEDVFKVLLLEVADGLKNKEQKQT